MSRERRGKKKSDNSTSRTPREEFSDIPLSDLISLRDKVGTKEFTRVYHHTEKRLAPTPVSGGNKDRGKPPEFSSKKRPRNRPIKQSHSPPAMDPRFDDRAGTFNQERFERAYAFLDPVRREERAEVERQLEGGADRGRLEGLLERMKGQERARREREADREVEREWLRAEREKVGKGKRRFFLQKSELRRLQLKRRLGETSKRKRIEKRRKRLEKRSRKGIPRRRTPRTS